MKNRPSTSGFRLDVPRSVLVVAISDFRPAGGPEPGVLSNRSTLVGQRLPMCPLRTVYGARQNSLPIWRLNAVHKCRLPVHRWPFRLAPSDDRRSRLESGNWYLPHPLLKQWVDGFIAECAAFPAGANDDQVDAWSQGAKRLLLFARRPSHEVSSRRAGPADHMRGWVDSALRRRRTEERRDLT